jgi:AcrR family transcriptional regulator
MIDLLPAGIEGSTRDRLIAAGIRLFAERGFKATTVGDIEAAAGLRPRRGALYHHFPTKHALLEAAIETHLASVEHARAQLESGDLGDVRSEALALGRFFLREMDAQRYLTHILEQDGDRIPDVRDIIRERLMEIGHRAAEIAIRHWVGPDADVDTKALAVILVAPIVNLRRHTWTFGARPLGVSDDQLLHTWADLCAHFANDFERGPR